MPLWELEDWLEEHDQPPNVLWGLKRLSANDTQANGSHQAGPYIPKDILFRVVPSLDRPQKMNPDVRFNLVINNSDARMARAVWYNNKLHNKGDNRKRRNETRITGLGGSASALLDPESTGALTVFAFWKEMMNQPFSCHIWVSRNEIEADIIEERTGPVPPGQWVTYPDLFTGLRSKADCSLDPEEIPPEWRMQFPSSKILVQRAIDMRRMDYADADHRLLARRACEFAIYRSLEKAVYIPRIIQGFDGIDDFLEIAHPIIQRRRSRGGRSLELHIRSIFLEENLKEEMDFSWQPTVDEDSHPDFLFPNIKAYSDPQFPSDRLRMLAVKSSVRERWRQILKESDRIKIKHLLTLQEGVSEKQFTAMMDEGVRLVVPERLHKRYPQAVRNDLLTLQDFLAEVREQAR